MGAKDELPSALLIHADPAHPLPPWADRFVARERARGIRVLAVQKGAFYAPPPPPPADPDRLLAREGLPEPTRKVPPPRYGWDALALWGPAFRNCLPSGAKSVPTGSPVLDGMVQDRGSGLKAFRSEARLQASRLLGVMPGTPLGMVAMRLHAHWWPEDRVNALLVAMITALQERGLQPIIRPDLEDGPDALRIYREAMLMVHQERKPIMLSRSLRNRLQPAQWLAAMNATVTQGDTDGILAAALGTSVVVVVTPDAPYHPDPIGTQGHYRVIREPLSYVGRSLAAALQPIQGKEHDPEAFREFAAWADGQAAENIANAVLEIAMLKRKKKKRTQAAETKAEAEPSAHEPAGSRV